MVEFNLDPKPGRPWGNHCPPGTSVSLRVTEVNPVLQRHRVQWSYTWVLDSDAPRPWSCL